MKVLQTIGRQGGSQEGIFQYRRQLDGVFIDAAVGRANLNPPEVILTHEGWIRILTAIHNEHRSCFRLTGTTPFNSPPNRSMHEMLSTAVPATVGG